MNTDEEQSLKHRDASVAIALKDRRPPIGSVTVGVHLIKSAVELLRVG